jgi:chromosome segregation ATPase
VAAPARKEEPEALNDWLERELRDTRARLHKVESELEQALKRTWTLESDVKRLSEAAGQTGSAASVVSSLREEVRQVRDQMSRMQDRQTAISNRAEEALRQRSAGDGRDKHDIGNVSKRIEAVSRHVEPFENRIQVLEEALRKYEEAVSGVRLTQASLDRIVEEVGTRANRALETASRIEQNVVSTTTEAVALRKADESLDERVKFILEQVYRAAERIEKLEEFADFPDEARELIHRATAERELLTQRMALIEKLVGDLSERTQTMGHNLAKVESRQHVQNAQIVDLSGQVNETAEQLLGQLKRFNQLLLRQRRRQLDTLAAEIKELGHGEPRQPDS